MSDTKEIIVFVDQDKVVEELDMSDYQCLGIQGALPINEACGGCVGCLLAQAVHSGWREEKQEMIDGIKKITMKYGGECNDRT